VSRNARIRRKYPRDIASHSQNVRLLVTDHSYVPQTKHHHVHCAGMAARNWLFPHVRGTHAQNMAVSALCFNNIINAHTYVHFACFMIIVFHLFKGRSPCRELSRLFVYILYFSILYLLLVFIADLSMLPRIGLAQNCRCISFLPMCFFFFFFLARYVLQMRAFY